MIAVVLKVHMHCEACAQEIRKRILKMKGEQMAAIKSLVLFISFFCPVCS